MQQLQTIALAVLVWLGDHPEIAWPILTALVSVLWGKLETHAPNVIALLKAVGFDLPGAKAAAVRIVSGYVERRRKPPVGQ